MNEWFEIQEIKNYIYVIKERLGLIDPRFLTEFTNMFLVLGSTKALLMDTGSGLYPIKPVVDMNQYKELRFEYKISSNRKNVEKTPIYANFNSCPLVPTSSFCSPLC